MIIKYINRSLCRPGLDHSRIGQPVLDRTLRGWKYILKKMVAPGESIAEEEEGS